MNKIIQDIPKFENFWKRILVTIGFAVVFLFGTYIVIPGVDPNFLTGLVQQTSGGLMALLDLFSGGAFSNASIFALGIIPYIFALIIVWLATIVVPSFRKMQKEGESGRRKINRVVRFVTVVILAVQGFAYVSNLKIQMMLAGSSLPSGWWYITLSITTIVAGSMFILWMCERITEKGIGNGFVFILVLGIINNLPKMVFQEFEARLNEQGGGLAMFFAEILFLLFVIAGSILTTHLIVVKSPKTNHI
jgi:Preprotein translocase subunit SecY